MKVTKWLKLVVTSPLTLLMGNMGDFAATGDEVSDDANEGDEGEGADPDADEADEDQEEGADEGDEDESGDPPEGEEDDQKGKPGKKGAQERIQQLANEKRELADQLKALEQRIAANEARMKDAAEDKPDFKVYPREQINAWLKHINEKIDEAELDGDLLAAEELREQKSAGMANIKAEEAKKKAWEERQGQKKNQTADSAKAREDFDKTAELYRQEVKVDLPTWEKMGKWFEGQINANPLLMAEFNDTFDRSGKVAAIRFAHQYTVKHMGAAAKTAIDKKTTAKDKTSKLSGSGPSGNAGSGNWQKQYDKLIAEGTEDAYVAAQALKRKFSGK